mgnify:CR=1 FL=1
MRYSLLSVLMLVAPFTSSTIAHAQSTGLDDMVGARAGQAESELYRRGYINAGGFEGDDRSYTNWWNASRRQCVTIATMDGRYSSITPTTPSDCGKSVADRSRRDQRSPDVAPRGDGFTAPGDLPRFCKGEAAAAFDRRPSDITTNLPIRRANGATVSGWFDGERGTKFFTCRFDQNGRFLSVN